MVSELKEFTGSEMDSAAGSSEHGNVLSNLILNQLSDYQMLKKEFNIYKHINDKEL
jgi:hypothetical protein